MPSSDDRHPPDHLRTVTIGAAYLIVSILVLMVIPPSNWEAEGWPRLSQFRAAWTASPTWHDGDPWITNFVGHPIMGALLFSFARHGQHSATHSFVFALVASCTWEYALESWFEQPSWTDLIVTPIAGALLGETRWQIRRRLLETPRVSWLRRALLALVAPVHAVWLATGRRASTPGGRRARID